MLSIVIPTLNRYSYLENTVKWLLSQSFQQFEILIVDQSDVFNTGLFGIDDRIRHLRLAEKSASKARNVGLLEARGDVVLFLDDDIIIDNPDFLYNHVRHYKSANCVGVSGAILNEKKEFRNSRHKWSLRPRTGWLFFPVNYDQPTTIGNGWAGNLSVRRSMALEVGGMDERYEKGAFREESDFCARLVRKYGPLVFDPAAYIIHIGAPTGGLRSFKKAEQIKAQHHFDGMFYYLFRNVRLIDYPFHLVSFLTIFFKRSVIRKRPLLIFTFFKRTIVGIFNATGKVIAGRKLLDKS